MQIYIFFGNKLTDRPPQNRLSRTLHIDKLPELSAGLLDVPYPALLHRHPNSIRFLNHRLLAVPNNRVIQFSEILYVLLS